MASGVEARLADAEAELIFLRANDKRLTEENNHLKARCERLSMELLEGKTYAVRLRGLALSIRRRSYPTLAPRVPSSSLNRRRRSGAFARLLKIERHAARPTAKNAQTSGFSFFFSPPSFTLYSTHSSRTPPRLVDLQPPVCAFVFLVWAHTVLTFRRLLQT